MLIEPFSNLGSGFTKLTPVTIVPKQFCNQDLCPKISAWLRMSTSVLSSKQPTLELRVKVLGEDTTVSSEEGV